MRSVLIPQPARGVHRRPGTRVPRAGRLGRLPGGRGVRRPRDQRHDRQAPRVPAHGRGRRQGQIRPPLRLQARPLRPQPLRFGHVQGEATQGGRRRGERLGARPGRPRGHHARVGARGYGGVLQREPLPEHPALHGGQRHAVPVERRAILRVPPRGRPIRGGRGRGGGGAPRVPRGRGRLDGVRGVPRLQRGRDQDEARQGVARGDDVEDAAQRPLHRDVRVGGTRSCRAACPPSWTSRPR